MKNILHSTGDKGFTKLCNNVLIRKDDTRIDACGSVDELSSFLGYAVSTSKDNELKQILKTIQKDLYFLSVDLANSPEGKFLISEKHIRFIEENVNKIEKSLPPMKKFTIPGGTETAAFLHVTRTVCRRCERVVVRASDKFKINPNILIYLNRLSFLLYMLARKQNFNKKVKEEILSV